jgi:hypothetical protein
MWLVLALVGCEKNACVEMCQAYKRWIDKCSSSWEAEFPDEDWHSVDDCYDTIGTPRRANRTNATPSRQSYDTRSCY